MIRLQTAEAEDCEFEQDAELPTSSVTSLQHLINWAQFTVLFCSSLFLISYQDVMPWDNYAAIIRKSDGGGTAHSVSMQQGNMMQWTNQNWIKVLNTTDFIL